MKKNIIIILLFFIFTFSISNQSINRPKPQGDEILFIKGSNIYIKIFLFFFPLAKNYETFFTIINNNLTAEIKIKKENFINEPKTTPLFETDLIFRLKDIPLNQTGEFLLPITIRGNKKVNFQQIKCIVYNINNILVINGSLSNLKIKDLTSKETSVKRINLKYPFYFDLRLQLPTGLVKQESLK